MLLGIAAALGLGLVVGLVNGLIITRLKVNAFIATLGTALVMRGLLNASFENFSGAVPPEFQALGYDSIGPVPWSILLLLGLAGGRGSVLGTLAGVLIFAIIDNVFNEFQVDPFLKTLLRGVIIVGAVASYSFRSREMQA
jgi:ribose transport system permease protein